MTKTRPPQDPNWRQKYAAMTPGGKPTNWSPKWLRECLCAQQGNAPDELTRNELQRLVDLLDLHRPLDRDGKHRVHTPTCGCP